MKKAVLVAVMILAVLGLAAFASGAPAYADGSARIPAPGSTPAPAGEPSGAVIADAFRKLGQVNGLHAGITLDIEMELFMSPAGDGKNIRRNGRERPGVLSVTPYPVDKIIYNVTII